MKNDDKLLDSIIKKGYNVTINDDNGGSNEQGN